MKRTFLILIALAIGLSGFAQEPWTLEKCIEHAQQNNLTVQRMLLQANFSENTLKQSKENLFPSISGSSSYSYNVGRSVNPYTNEFITEGNHSLNFSLGASVVLFNGLRNINTIKKNKLDMLADVEAVERVKRDVSLEVGLAFLLILRNEEMLKAAEGQVETTKSQVDRTKKLVAAGSLPEGNLLEIQAQQAREQTAVIEAQNQLTIAKLNLSQLLELESPEGFDIVRPELGDISALRLEGNVKDIYSNVTNLPELKEAELKLKSAEKSLTIAKGMYSPELSASAGVYTGYSSAREHAAGDPILFSQKIGEVETTGETVIGNGLQYQFETIPMSDQLSDNLSQQFGINLRIPIYSQGQIRTQVSNAKIGILDAKTNIELVKRNVYKSIQQAYADAEASMNRYNSNKITVEALVKAFDYTQRKFEVGAVNSYEYNQAKNNLFRAQTDLTQAKFDYVFRLKVLDFYKGVPITL